VAGGDWLCDQDVGRVLRRALPEEMVQLEHWGCPWSRKADGHVNVRAFGGMKIERTWLPPTGTGFHMLHTLFPDLLSTRASAVFDEYFCSDLLVQDGRAQGDGRHRHRQRRFTT
jgi:fumarate reductase flavoprotein subunit